MPAGSPRPLVSTARSVRVEQPSLDRVLVEERDLLEALGRHRDRLGHAVELEVAERFLAAPSSARPSRSRRADRDPVTTIAVAPPSSRIGGGGGRGRPIVERRARAVLPSG
jgi:hypothetical protein